MDPARFAGLAEDDAYERALIDRASGFPTGYRTSSSRAAASFRSAVSKPSLNQS